MSLPVAILGAGPIGLDAALTLAERHVPFRIYEASVEPAAHVRAWGHVRMFSPWSMNVSARMSRALEAAGREVPEGAECPTGADYVREVLEPAVAVPEIRSALFCDARVVAVAREGLLKNEAIGAERRAAQPFRLLVRDGAGRERVERASAVLDCTGTYGQPNPMGAGGIPAPGEGQAEPHIRRHIPDFRAEHSSWAGRSVLLVGAGHSAQAAAVELARLVRDAPGTSVVWAVRDEAPTWGAVAQDPLPGRAALAAEAHRLAQGGLTTGFDVVTGASVQELEVESDGVRVRLTRRGGAELDVRVDRILSLTGYVGDHRIYRQLQVHECYASTAPMKLAAALLAQEGGAADCLAGIDGFGPDSLRTPEAGFFILGSKSYGRTSAFLLQTGFKQVDDVLSLLRPRTS